VSEELETLGLNTSNPPPEPHAAVDRPGTEPSTSEEEGEAGTATSEPTENTEDDSRPAANGHARANGHSPTGSISGAKDAKLEAMSEDHDALRLEVEQLRKQVESTQESHSQETAQLRADLEDAEAAKEYAETQYQTLLNRVEKIKETLGDRLKRDKAELEDTKDRVDELERQNDELQRTVAEREEEAGRLRDEAQEQGRELAGLRSRSNLSQQNWLKEKDDIVRQMQFIHYHRRPRNYII
jgi:DNA repair exonuclease SbcCD ATPase subunit